MNPELTVTIERIDDLVLLIGVMMRLNLPAILDRHLRRHGLQQGLSWGWVATIWLAHILSQGDHRKVTVRDWVGQAHETLERVTGLSIRATDFTDDRLTLVLKGLSQPASWQAIEQELGQQTIQVYDLKSDRVRLDPTTVSGYHQVSEARLFQFGQSKDNPDLAQIKVMVGALDPLGLPLVTEVVSGERADDGLYIPAAERIMQIMERSGLLFVGDSKMSALATRAYLQVRRQYYLTPLAVKGQVATELDDWVKAALEQQVALTQLYDVQAGQAPELLAEGYERSRTCTTVVNDQTVTWTERLFVIHSASYAQSLQRGLEQRLSHATAELGTLTPARGRGKRQIESEAELVQRAQAILTAHRVEGLLTYQFERQQERQTRFIGPGRGRADRPTREISRVRYQITAVTRQTEAIAAVTRRFGWRVYATNAPLEELTLAEAVWTYRAEWRVERGFHRLKGAPLSLDPLFVQRDDQVVGLTHLLSLAVRLLTLMEFVVRRTLHQNQEQLVGLHPENPKKGTDTPTSERLLKAFNNINLTIIHLPQQLVRHVTPLTPLQQRILELLDLSPALYGTLADNST
jgi:transposase